MIVKVIFCVTLIQIICFGNILFSMEQNIHQQRQKQLRFSSSNHLSQYIRKIQVENIEQSLYICLIQLRRNKVQLLQEYNRQFSRKHQIELNIKHINRTKQKQIILESFEKQQKQKSEQRMKDFILCGKQQSLKIIKNNKKLGQIVKQLEQKQRRRKQQLELKEKQLEAQKKFTQKLEKDIQIIQSKIERGQSQNFEQEKALYQKKIQELEAKFFQKKSQGFSESKKVDQVMKLRQLNKELKNRYNEARFNKEMEFGIAVQYDSDSQIAQKMRQISQDARIKQSIQGQLVHFIEKGVNLKQENQILTQFLQMSEEQQN